MLSINIAHNTNHSEIEKTRNFRRNFYHSRLKITKSLEYNSHAQRPEQLSKENWSPTIFVHGDFKAFLQSTRAALVSVYLIHGTVALAVGCPTSVWTISADTSLEKSTAAIACIDSVMFPRGAVSAHFTGDIQKTSFSDQIKRKEILF